MYENPSPRSQKYWPKDGKNVCWCLLGDIVCIGNRLLIWMEGTGFSGSNCEPLAKRGWELKRNRGNFQWIASAF